MKLLVKVKKSYNESRPNLNKTGQFFQDEALQPRALQLFIPPYLSSQTLGVYIYEATR